MLRGGDLDPGLADYLRRAMEAFSRAAPTR
jgi:hypothetical protein